MIIKVTRLQAWAPAGGGESVGRRPTPQKFLAILGAFSPWGAFLLYGGGLFLACPRSPTKISAGAHDCKEGSRACSPEILCDRNLVSSGHVLLRFCLKNDKHNDKL